MTRAFLIAGSRSTLVSLWSVEDSTADFMSIFYTGVKKKLSLASALRAAKLSYMEKSLPLSGNQRLSLSHPFFWAPFVLTTTESRETLQAENRR